MKTNNMNIVMTTLLFAVAVGCASSSSTRRPARASPEESREVYRAPVSTTAEPSADRSVPMPGMQTEPGSVQTDPASERAPTPPLAVTQEPLPDREPTGGTRPSTSEVDNTRVNERDADEAALTPMDQGNSKEDLRITKAIRQAVVADDALSFTAKNVKIITLNGKVTLRGPVNSDGERTKIEAMARRVAGATHVDNQLEVKR